MLFESEEFGLIVHSPLAQAKAIFKKLGYPTVEEFGHNILPPYQNITNMQAFFPCNKPPSIGCKLIASATVVDLLTILICVQLLFRPRANSRPVKHKRSLISLPQREYGMCTTMEITIAPPFLQVPTS